MQEPGVARLTTVLVVLVVACILNASQPLIAQRLGSAPGPKTNHPYTPRDDARNGGTAFEKRETPADQEKAMLRRRAATELAEDLDRLMRINRERILPLSSSQSLDYNALSQVTGEINGRAKRIKSNSPLALREKKGEKRTYEADAAHLGSMLPELSRLIESFLSNPVFSTASVHDNELLSTAGRDLESIIRLSDTINKVAKRLAKTATESAKSQRA